MKPIKVINLRCEYLDNPLGVHLTGRGVRFNWTLESDERGQKQSAYQILVATSEALLNEAQPDLWNSGKVESEQSIHVEYQGLPLKSRILCYWQVRVWDKSGNASDWSLPAKWSMGLLDRNEWKAQWISCPSRENKTEAPMLRREFNISGAVKRATLYVTSRGLYEMRINGCRVGNHLLAPEWTNYKKRIQYQTYDVTGIIRPGANAIGGILGEGWYAGPLQQWPPRMYLYGSKLELLAQLEIMMDDGNVYTVTTDNAWKCTLDGPVVFSRIYEGETYDARREKPGWSEPGFDDRDWQPVMACGDLGKALFTSQPNEAIRIIRKLKPIAVTEPRNGLFVIDLGQNMVGWCRIIVRADAGTKISFKYNERLNPDGSVYMDNLRAGGLAEEKRRQLDEYICKGKGKEVFEPHFTYHGFRYVEVSGLQSPPEVEGMVLHSSAPLAGSFKCSDQHLNRLWQNILWSQRGNLMGIPTDCPQRDERMGWMGDMQTFCQTAIFNMNLAAFLGKWIQDMRDDQLEDGRFPGYVPYPDITAKYAGLPAWADAGTTVPWLAYLNYADRHLLEAHYESAKRWVDYVKDESRDLIWEKASPGGGDWLNIGGSIPVPLFSTAFFARSTEIVAKMAMTLKRDEEARKYNELFENIKKVFIHTFIGQDGRLEGDSQGAYALILHFGLFPENLRRSLAGHMLEAVKRNDWHLTTGINTTHLLMLELSNNGYHEAACRLALAREMPSWLFMIQQGATTIWERWDGWMPEKGFQDNRMNSFNHFVFGAIGEWMMRNLAGLNPDDTQPGWKHFLIKPRLGGSLSNVSACYESAYGRIACDWKQTDRQLLLNITVPVNTTATLHIPAYKAASITETKQVGNKTPGVKFVKTEKDVVIYDIDSGSYCFEVKY